MLIDRRQAIIHFGMAGIGAIAWPLLGQGQTAEAHPTRSRTERPDQGSDLEAEARLRADLARLAPRAYSEEGVPVFLACVNLVGAPSKVNPGPFSAALASTFHRNAQAFQHMQPNARPGDVQQIIEVLADRDFAAGAGTDLQ